MRIRDNAGNYTQTPASERRQESAEEMEAQLLLDLATAKAHIEILEDDAAFLLLEIAKLKEGA